MRDLLRRLEEGNSGEIATLTWLNRREVSQLDLDVRQIRIATVRTTAMRVDEWAELTVEVTGAWPDPRTVDRDQLGRAIAEKLWDHPAWKSEVRQRRGQTVEVGYVGDTQGDGGPTHAVPVPLPASPRDLELVGIDKAKARFVMANR